jgi:hypothetical protein
MMGFDFDGIGNILIAVMVFLAICLPAALIFRQVLPRMIERQGQLEEFEFRFRELQEEALELQAHLRATQSQCVRLGMEKNRLESDLRKLERNLANAQMVPDFIHELGDPRSNSQKFTAKLTLENSSLHNRTTGEPFNPIWRYKNTAEVWAANLDEARGILDAAFPGKLGYQRSFSAPPPSEEGRR